MAKQKGAKTVQRQSSQFLRCDGHQYVLLLFLTTEKPSAPRIAVEVPATGKKRAGLDQALRQ